MFLRRNYTILEKIFICSLIMLHLTLILPLSEVFPLPKTVTRPEVFAEEPTNHPPVIYYINSILVTADQDITLQPIDEGDTLIIEPQVYDSDGDALHITFVNLVKSPELPEKEPVSIAGFEDSGEWNTSYNDAGSYKVTVRVDDLNGGVATKDVYFEINDKETSPVVSISLSDNTVNLGDSFNIHVEVDDLHVEDTTGDVSPSKHPVSYVEGAHIDTSQKKFDNGSCLFDGEGDYLSIPDSPDWDICGSSTDDWAIDFWIKMNTHSRQEWIIEHHHDPSNNWWIEHKHDARAEKGFKFYAESNGVLIDTNYGGEITDSEWHHVALCKVGRKYAIYVDGKQANYTDDFSPGNFEGDLVISGHKASGDWFDGHIDELRISHANVFGASPNTNPMLLPDKFDVPTGEHFSSGAVDDPTKLLLHFNIPDGEPLIPTLLINGEPFSDTAGIPSYIYGSGSFDKTYSINDPYLPGIYTITARITHPTSSRTYEASTNIEVADESAGEDDILPISGDFNGDGLTDIGTWDKRNDTWTIAFSEKGEFNNVRSWSDIFGSDNYNRDFTFPITGDFNGDGRTDIGLYVIFKHDGDSDNNKKPGGTWMFALLDPDTEDFIYDVTWDVSKFGGGENMRPLIGDFNGDGITDIGYSDSSSDEGRFCIKLAKEDKKGFENNAILFQTGLEDSSTYSGDFNGDGLADILAFNKDDGDWNVLLAQDATSSQLVDWVQEAISGDTIYEVPGGSTWGTHNSTSDGDFNTSAGGRFYAESGEDAVAITTTFTFPKAVNITNVVSKSETYGGGSGSVSQIKVYLFYDGDWQEIAPDAANNTIVSTYGDWSGVTKAKLYSYRRSWGDGCEFDCRAENFELQAWGPSDTVKSNEGLLAFANGMSKSGFGTNKEPTLTDYNHDGKTDIGYFDPDTGEWHYALSNGVQFDREIHNPDWPGIEVGSSDLPSGGDYNGDGIGDTAIFHKDQQGVLGKWEIVLHNSKQPDLLVCVDSGIGGTTNIEYEVSTQLDNTGDDAKPDLPFPVPVVKKVTKTDGMGHSYEVNYEYQDGMFETDSREFRGFKYVKVIDVEDTVKETWFHQDNIYKGKPEEERVSDASGRIYNSVQHEWGSVIAHSGSVTFPYLASKTSTLYNVNDGTGRDIRTTYSGYDDYGNVGRIDELGFVDDPDDDRSTLIEYEYNTEKYIVNKPKYTTIYKGETIVSKTSYTYDSLLGSLKEEKKWLDTGPDPVTTFTYDYENDSSIHCGNIVKVEDALGHATETEYNPDYGYTFPTKVTNTLLHTQQFTYDKATGQILTSTDPNGQITKTVYDGFGRITEISGPYTQENIDTLSSRDCISYIKYDYELESMPLKIITETKVDDAKFIKSYAFIDGLGRTIEVKTPAENPTEQIISGIVKYDSRGQVREKYLPDVVDYSEDYIPPDYEQPRITYFYDPVGRVIQTVQPDGVVSYVQYDGWIVTTIDANKNRIVSEKDAYGRLTKVIEYDGTETYTTKYKYDALGNLIETIDAQSNVTTIKYDTLGRKISMDDPDMGSWSYEYDAVGNLLSQTDAKGQTLTFQYDEINRLTSKSTDVTYAYNDDLKAGDTPLSNGIGRLDRVTDSSGKAEFFYDNLGREIKTIKTVKPDLDTHYEIYRTYDSIDRLKTVKYPDGEVITYTYNKAGGVETISSPSQTYVTNVNYNEYGQMARVDYGNNTHTEYTYDPNTLRLGHLATQSPSGTIQDLSYGFDNVGNVLSITDKSSTGTNSQSFEYDDLNRLTKATGAGYGTINYSYDSIGNMLEKDDIKMQYGPQAHCLTAGPHAVTSTQRPGTENVEINVTPTDYVEKSDNWGHWEYGPPGSMYACSTLGNEGYLDYSVDFGSNNSNAALEVSAINIWGELPGDYTHFNLEIYIDNIIYGILSVPVSTTEYQTGSIELGALEGGHIIRFIWINDYYIPEQYDANIQINSIKFDVSKENLRIIAYDTNGNMISKQSGNYPKTFAYDIENRLTEVTEPKEEYISNYTINLNSGWNFVSLPVIVTQDIPTILQSSAITKAEIAHYDSATQNWKLFAYEEGLNLTEYCDFTDFEYGKGYQIYVESACTLTISGTTSLSEKQLTVTPGQWNLIAAPTTTSISAEDALQGLTYTKVRRYSGTDYEEVTELTTGEAYFVYLDPASTSTWNIPREQDKTQFLYDGDGGRVKKISSEETVTYIGSSYEIQTTGVETKIKKHIFMGSTRVCTVEDDGTPTKYRYFHQDHIGSSNVITNSDGQIAKLIEYTPYGLTAREPDEYNKYDTDCLYTGKLFDTSTDLYYYGARYYDPELGRFITADTIVPYPNDPQSFNRYAYARNNPIRYIDPTGHSWWSAFWNFVAGLAGAVVTAVLTPVMGIQAAAAFGGATTGAILGAIDGGLGGALKGAGIGFVMGATLGTGVDIWGAPFALAAAAGGAAVAGVSGGLEGLGDFAAGAAGASMGYTIGSALAPQRAYAQTETQSALSESEQRQIKQQLSAGQLESPTGITKRSAPTVVRKAEEAKITSNLAEKGAVGIGNNPSVENNATETKSIFTLVGRRENAFVYDWEGVGIENLSVKFQWRGADVFSVDMNVEKFAQYGIKIGPFDIPITPWIPMAEIDRTLPWYYPAIYNNKSKYK